MLFTCYSRLKEYIYRTSWNVKSNMSPTMIRTFYGTTIYGNILWNKNVSFMGQWNTTISRYGNMDCHIKPMHEFQHYDIFQNMILPSLYMIDCLKTWYYQYIMALKGTLCNFWPSSDAFCRRTLFWLCFSSVWLCGWIWFFYCS